MGHWTQKTNCAPIHFTLKKFSWKSIPIWIYFNKTDSAIRNKPKPKKWTSKSQMLHHLPLIPVCPQSKALFQTYSSSLQSHTCPWSACIVLAVLVKTNILQFTWGHLGCTVNNFILSYWLYLETFFQLKYGFSSKLTKWRVRFCFDQMKNSA